MPTTPQSIQMAAASVAGPTLLHLKRFRPHIENPFGRCTRVLQPLRFFKLEDTAGIIIARVSTLMTPSSTPSERLIFMLTCAFSIKIFRPRYGDMGATTDQYRHVAPSIPVLTKEQEAGEFDGIIHAGDYAYDFAPYGGRVGDQFMNLIQPFASRVPYMAGVGNHESGGVNRKHFAMRFAGMQFVGVNSGATNGGMTEHGDQMWWSFDAGLVHWIAVDTELWNCAQMAYACPSSTSFL